MLTFVSDHNGIGKREGFQTEIKTVHKTNRIRKHIGKH